MLANVSESPCGLCHRQRQLRISHFMPAALYPANKKKLFVTTTRRDFDPEDIVAPLLCDECEGLFNRNGESEVLRWLAPKAKQGSSPLYTALRNGTPAWVDDHTKCYWGTSVGLSPERFAYFGLSLVWRAAAYEWPLPDGGFTPRLDLGEFAEPIRLFLREEAALPTSISGHADGLIVAPVMGALFRFWLGDVLPPPIARTVFFPADGNPVFVTNCWDGVLSNAYSHLFET
jgi:hypothetical protein